MHRTILSKKQNEILSFIQKFQNSFYLVGGTALALQMGHRRSIDYDLFTSSKLDHTPIEREINQHNFEKQIIRNTQDELTIILNQVKCTFYNYPFIIPHTLWFEDIISMPQIVDIAAMKAYALGRRAKWKDYVDLYIILKNYHSIKEISTKATQYFGTLFSEKSFREQLCYFKDINYSEEVDFIENQIDKKTIEEALVDIATNNYL